MVTTAENIAIADNLDAVAVVLDRWLRALPDDPVPRAPPDCWPAAICAMVAVQPTSFAEMTELVSRLRAGAMRVRNGQSPFDSVRRMKGGRR